MIAWACLVKAMETWQLNSHEHLHLTTSVVAEGANAFVACSNCATCGQQQHLQHHKQQQQQQRRRHEQASPTWGDPSAELHNKSPLACCKRASMAQLGRAKPAGGLDQFVLRANLVALDWA